MWSNRHRKLFTSILMIAMLSMAAVAQKAVQKWGGAPALWEETDISRKDLFYGPGGKEMIPDVSRVTFIKEEKGGHNKKYRIKDAKGRTWVAKLGREAQPETAAVRLMWALGYKTETNYLVPSITIPGKGTFTNVRLEARPDDVERLEEWKWKSNPFMGSDAFQAMKIMMVFMNNWDIVDVQNKVIRVDGKEQYIVSDLGSTFGKLGNNNLPVIYRLGRSVGKPNHYSRSSFIKGTKNGEVKLAYKGKNRGLFKGITVEQADWLAGLLSQLRDDQIRDAFRAANYSTSDINILTQAVKRRISELNKATSSERLAHR